MTTGTYTAAGFAADGRSLTNAPRGTTFVTAAAIGVASELAAA